MTFPSMISSRPRRPLSWDDIDLMQSPAQRSRRTIASCFGGAAIASVASSSVLPAAFLLAFVAAAISLLAGAMVRPARFSNTKIVAASVMTMLAILEGGCLALRQTISLSGEVGLIAKGPPLGWVLRPGAHPVRKSIDGRVIYDVTYGVDGHGHRATASASDGPGYAFLGDSFTFGEGLPDADTLPQAFADLLGGKTRIVNLGVPAYSPAQVLRELQLHIYDDVLPPGRGFFLLTAAWHVDRIACRDAWVAGAPRYVLDHGRLILDGACTVPRETSLAKVLMRAAIYQVLVAPRWQLIDANDIATYIDIVVEAARVARVQYGVPLRVIYLRNPGYLSGTGVTDEEIMARMRAGGAEVLDLTLPHEGHGDVAILGDGHPSGIANRLRAKMLRDAINAEQSGTVSSMVQIGSDDH